MTARSIDSARWAVASISLISSSSLSELVMRVTAPTAVGGAGQLVAIWPLSDPSPARSLLGRSGPVPKRVSREGYALVSAAIQLVGRTRFGWRPPTSRHRLRLAGAADWVCDWRGSHSAPTAFGSDSSWLSSAPSERSLWWGLGSAAWPAAPSVGRPAESPIDSEWPRVIPPTRNQASSP